MIDFSAALAAPLTLEPVPAHQIISGEPSTGSAALGVFNGQEFGVWEMSVGAMSDVETDELFIVIAGRASVELDSGERFELVSGSTFMLSEGDRTVWTVSETLRKIYVVGAQ